MKNRSDTFLVYILWLALALALSSAVSHAAPVTRFIHNDALGSPVAATDQNGDVVWKEEYKPFGERIIKDGNADTQKRWFTGHVQDKDTGLVYMGARFYDPSIGRFLSPDPVGFSPNTPMMFNRYAYANNNPYKYVDPDGRAPHRWADGNYSDNDGQANPGWSAQINRAQGQIGYGLAEGWQYSPAIMVGAGEGVALFGLLKQGFKKAAKSAGSAKNPANGLKLNKQLGSQQQLAEKGITIAGQGAKQPFRGADDAAKKYGDNSSDYVKKSSSSHTAPDGTKFETHFIENTRTSQRFEHKTKFTD